MLIDFTVSNFKSYKEENTLSLAASSDKQNEENNTFLWNKKRLLTSAVIYGANASGKSNLIQAIAAMKNLVEFSEEEGDVAHKLGITEFKFNKQSKEEPTSFEINFIQENTEYIYGFSLNRGTIKEEWLFARFKKRLVNLFERSKKTIIWHPRYFKEAKELEAKTRADSLFLVVCAKHSGKISTEIKNWFRYRLWVSHGIEDELFIASTMHFLEKHEYKKHIIDFLRSTDSSIKNFSYEIKNISEEELKKLIEKGQPPILQYGKSVVMITTEHNYFDGNKLKSRFSLNFKDESEGTKRLFFLSVAILKALKEGKVLVVDELDSRLHPLLVNHIVSLFHSSETNRKNGQLIFVTHNTSLLRNISFRRDQIWFAEKDSKESTQLYSLNDYKLKVRKDETFEKNYLLGKYGAIPLTGELLSLIDE